MTQNTETPTFLLIQINDNFFSDKKFKISYKKLKKKFLTVPYSPSSPKLLPQTFTLTYNLEASKPPCS